MKLADSSLPQVNSSEYKIFSNEDIDNLVIIDGCRADTYSRVVKDSDTRVTKASNSYEFIGENFTSGDFDDFVYVTANPHFDPGVFEEITGRKPGDVFHEVFHTYRHGWDDNLSTVPPEEVSNEARTASKLFPEKSLVIHYMQPHYPFIHSELENKGISNDLSTNENSVWQDLMRGRVDRNSVIEAYRNNLRYVMDEVEELCGDLTGRSVITSDHGNFIGENNLYGHPEGMSSEPVRCVPWDVRE
ncbi:MAG: hypothetical protein ABEJ72_05875 [Candidatus Aenigmatarchaeota archaeon]